MTFTDQIDINDKLEIYLEIEFELDYAETCEPDHTGEPVYQQWPGLYLVGSTMYRADEKIEGDFTSIAQDHLDSLNVYDYL